MKNKPINSIYLVSELIPSGPINQSLNIVSSFNPKDVNAIIVTLFDEREESWIQKFRDKGIEIVQLHSSRKKFLNSKKQMIKLIKERDIDVVHSSGLSADLVNSMLVKHVATVSTFRSHISDLGERSNFIVRSISRNLYRYLMHKIKMIVGCSKSLASDMGKEIGRSCEMVQNGADIDHYMPLSDSEKSELRKKLDIPITSMVYVTVGNLEPRKNMPLIVKAFNEINDDELTLLIVGEGEDRKVLEDLIQGKKNIKLIGKVNDPLPYYQASDFLISSSLAEGLPNTVLEGMSCGLPCLLSDIGPHFEMLEYDQHAGMTFNRYDYKELAKLIKESTNWDIRLRSDKARKLIENNLSKYCMASKYAKLYKKALEVK